MTIPFLTFLGLCYSSVCVSSPLYNLSCDHRVSRQSCVGLVSFPCVCRLSVCPVSCLSSLLSALSLIFPVFFLWPLCLSVSLLDSFLYAVSPHLSADPLCLSYFCPSCQPFLSCVSLLSVSLASLSSFPLIFVSSCSHLLFIFCRFRLLSQCFSQVSWNRAERPV